MGFLLKQFICYNRYISIIMLLYFIILTSFCIILALCSTFDDQSSTTVLHIIFVSWFRSFCINIDWRYHIIQPLEWQQSNTFFLRWREFWGKFSTAFKIHVFRIRKKTFYHFPWNVCVDKTRKEYPF